MQDFATSRSSGDLGVTQNPWLHRFDQLMATLADEQIALRRHMHAHPEPSGEEVETTQLIVNRLRELGLSPTVCRSDVDVVTGAYVDVNSGSAADADAPLIAIRCDIDALRMSDAKTVEYRSQREGVAHCCGHDAHTAIVLGLGTAAVKTFASEAGTPTAPLRLRLIFQPCEEEEGGADWMVAQGAMDGVDRVLGVHVDPERLVGRVGIRYGVLTAACDEVHIEVTGQGGHAARPHQSIDPIAATAHLVSTLYEFLPRRVDARHPAVFTAGQIQGGTASNVIPNCVRLAGTLRTTDEKTRAALKIEMDRICRSLELSTGVKVSLRFACPYASVVNEDLSAAALETASRDVLGTSAIEHITLPSMGGEDFSVYQSRAPGAMLRLGCAREGSVSHFLHSPLFDIEEAALAVGTRILMRAALNLAVSLRN